MKAPVLFSYASKSVLRQKSRNAFIIITISSLSVFSLFMSFLFEGKNFQLEDAIIKTHTGTLQVLDQEFAQRNDPYSPSLLNQELRSSLEKDFLISPEVLMETTVLHPAGAEALTLIGVDPELHERLFPLGLGGLKDDEVLIGEQFAKKVNLAIGEKLIITYQNSEKAILNESFNVTAVYHRFGQGFQESYAFVTKKRLSELMGLPHEGFHRIVLMPKDEKARPTPSLTGSSGTVIKTWRELNPELSVLMKFHDGITTTLLLFIMLVTAASIVTPISIMWDERSDEIKMLQTIGAQERVLKLICIFESVFLTLTSFVLTVLVCALLLTPSMKYGIDFAALGAGTAVRSGIVISSVVRPVINGWYALIILGFNFVVIFGCNILSVRSVTRKLNDAL